MGFGCVLEKPSEAMFIWKNEWLVGFGCVVERTDIFEMKPSGDVYGLYCILHDSVLRGYPFLAFHKNHYVFFSFFPLGERIKKKLHIQLAQDFGVSDYNLHFKHKI